MRKICVITGSRAEYGLLRPLMEEIRGTSGLALQLLVTGMHLSPEFGLTFREIEKDGFTIDRKVEMLLSSDTPVAIAKATGLGMIGFADALQELQPDILVVLGDRFEILAAVTTALYALIPVAHIHGGESTRGAFDEGIRHAITKMSHLHYVAAEEYRRRVIQLGENPLNVHTVGGLGVDGLLKTELVSREELQRQLGFRFGKRNLLITFHPVTLEYASAEGQLAELFMALSDLPEDIHFWFTLPNADTSGRALISMIGDFVRTHSRRSMAFTSLGQQRYWSMMRLVDAVVGNSSSGLLEAPSLKVPTVDIGDRQAGRLAATSVIHCTTDRSNIRDAIDRALSVEFRAIAKATHNPYGDGGACRRIVRSLNAVELTSELLKKKFYDLDLTSNDVMRQEVTTCD